jgi:glycyl-tRNA synthetase beta chain
MGTDSLLIELLCEELPPKALRSLGEVFASSLSASLRKQGLIGDDAVVENFASPRRLAARISAVAEQGQSQTVVTRLMPAKVGWLDGVVGQASPALRKKLESIQPDTDISTLLANIRTESDGKQEVLVLASELAGVSVEIGVQRALDGALAALPVPKVMTYQLDDGRDVKFARPVQGLLALYGRRTLPLQALGHAAGSSTAGHRFLARGAVDIKKPESYVEALEQKGYVMAGFGARRERIVAALQAGADGAHVIAPDALLDEVTALVEWPVVYAGTFDAAFLEVPQECLILTMQLNQKYFALADRPLAEGGKLINRFLLVSNLATDKPAAIVTGNERVLRARLADARFFFDVDRRAPLESRLARLSQVVYHNQLGTQLERVERLVVQAGAIAERIGSDGRDARRAARLAKADLVTDMVGEFPELQGLMGRYYALHDGESTMVAEAIEQHYRPRFAGDALPGTGVAAAVALADKLDTLVGIFGIGQKPTGDKDPYGLRRAALGVIRILVETPLSVDFAELVDIAVSTFSGGLAPTTRDDVVDFIHDRVRFWFREQGFETNEVEAVVGQRPDRLDTVPVRLAAVNQFRQLPEAASLAAANKRVQNILKKSEEAIPEMVESTRLIEVAEVALARELATVLPQVKSQLAADNYSQALLLLAALRTPVDDFFDTVMVNAEDAQLRRNRLALLRQLATAFNAVADISRLAA